jgi:hypothetical protein
MIRRRSRLLFPPLLAKERKEGAITSRAKPLALSCDFSTPAQLRRSRRKCRFVLRADRGTTDGRRLKRTDGVVPLRPMSHEPFPSLLIAVHPWLHPCGRLAKRGGMVLESFKSCKWRSSPLSFVDLFRAEPAAPDAETADSFAANNTAAPVAGVTGISRHEPVVQS